MAKVSVIVPAYNSEKTIKDCLISLVNQTLTDIEIIVVNDCSTDNTMALLLAFEKNFPEKLLIVNSDINRGAGGARNIGLGYASGEYIGFVDSDDLIVPEMYEKLLNKAVSGSYDIVDCGYYCEATDTAIVHTSDELAGNLNGYKRSELIASGGYFWSRLFKKSFLDEIGLHFRENCILEDCETLMLTFAKAHKIGNVKEILYCYKDYKTSISKCFNAASYFNNATAAINAIYGTLSTLDNYEEFRLAVEYSIVNLCSLCANVCLTHGAKDPEFIKLDRLRQINSYIKSMVQTPFKSNKYIINKISPKDIDILNDIRRL